MTNHYTVSNNILVVIFQDINQINISRPCQLSSCYQLATMAKMSLEERFGGGPGNSYTKCVGKAFHIESMIKKKKSIPVIVREIDKLKMKELFLWRSRL